MTRIVSTSKLKPGDKVRCIYRGQFIDHNFVQPGQIYTVAEFRISEYLTTQGKNKKFPEMRLMNDTKYFWYDAMKFDKI